MDAGNFNFAPVDEAMATANVPNARESDPRAVFHFHDNYVNQMDQRNSPPQSAYYSQIWSRVVNETLMLCRSLKSNPHLRGLAMLLILFCCWAAVTCWADSDGAPFRGALPSAFLETRASPARDKIQDKAYYGCLHRYRDSPKVQDDGPVSKIAGVNGSDLNVTVHMCMFCKARPTWDGAEGGYCGKSCKEHADQGRTVPAPMAAKAHVSYAEYVNRRDYPNFLRQLPEREKRSLFFLRGRPESSDAMPTTGRKWVTYQEAIERCKRKIGLSKTDIKTAWEHLKARSRAGACADACADATAVFRSFPPARTAKRDSYVGEQAKNLKNEMIDESCWAHAFVEAIRACDATLDYETLRATLVISKYLLEYADQALPGSAGELLDLTRCLSSRRTCLYGEETCDRYDAFFTGERGVSSMAAWVDRPELIIDQRRLLSVLKGLLDDDLKRELLIDYMMDHIVDTERRYGPDQKPLFNFEDAVRSASSDPISSGPISSDGPISEEAATDYLLGFLAKLHNTLVHDFHIGNLNGEDSEEGENRAQSHLVSYVSEEDVRAYLVSPNARPMAVDVKGEGHMVLVYVPEEFQSESSIPASEALHVRDSLLLCDPNQYASADRERLRELAAEGKDPDLALYERLRSRELGMNFKMFGPDEAGNGSEKKWMMLDLVGNFNTVYRLADNWMEIREKLLTRQYYAKGEDIQHMLDWIGYFQSSVSADEKLREQFTREDVRERLRKHYGDARDPPVLAHCDKIFYTLSEMQPPPLIRLRSVGQADSRYRVFPGATFKVILTAYHLQQVTVPVTSFAYLVPDPNIRYGASTQVWIFHNCCSEGDDDDTQLDDASDPLLRHETLRKTVWEEKFKSKVSGAPLSGSEPGTTTATACTMTPMKLSLHTMSGQGAAAGMSWCDAGLEGRYAIEIKACIPPSAGCQKLNPELVCVDIFQTDMDVNHDGFRTMLICKADDAEEFIRRLPRA